MILALIKIPFDFAASCAPGGSFFGLPTWYKYLPSETDPVTHKCSPTVNGLNDLWAIGFAIIEILLMLAGFLAAIYIIISGLRYVTSQGNPEKAASARTGIINAVVGMGIVIIATAVVRFIGAKIGG